MTEKSRGRRNFWKYVLATLCLVLFGGGLFFWSLRARPALGGEPPPGYASIDLIKLAIVTGQLPLVDRTPPIPDGIEVTRDIEYGRGGDKPLLLDLYAPRDLDHAVAGLIFIHGGGWKSGDRGDYQYYGVKFARQGYVVASISYRLRDEALFPAAVEDAKCAVRWMRANAESLHVDPERIAVIGGSAGGHLSLMVGYSSDVAELEGDGGHNDVGSRVAAVVDLYGPVDLTTEYARTHALVTNFIGRSFEDAPELYEQASPLTYLSADDPPTLIFHGTIDDLVFIRQSDRLDARLSELGIPHEYDRLEGWPHAMDAAQVVNDYCVERMLAFFEEHLAAPGAKPDGSPPILIDGEFDDWTSIPSHMDPEDDTHDVRHKQRDDTPDHVDYPDVDLLEYKVTSDNENLYCYFRSRGEIGRTQTAGPGKQAGRYYVIATIDVDDDDDTGYWVHEGGYYPTSRGYDVNAEIEFYDGEFNTGHYLNHGARNEHELHQAFLDQTAGEYVAGNDGPYPHGFMRVLPGTYDFYTQWVYHDDGQITIVRDMGPVVPGVVTCAVSKDGHEIECRFPLKGFLADENGRPIIAPGSVLDLSFSLEASGELAPGGEWASDTGEPINGYVVTPQ
jgi:acetyl esterase/lipase